MEATELSIKLSTAKPHLPVSGLGNNILRDASKIPNQQNDMGAGQPYLIWPFA